jgi:hypothetical protein
MSLKPTSARGDWIKQVRFDMTFAEKTLMKDGDVGRMFVVHTKDAAKHVIAAPWDSDDEKAALIDMVRTYCIAYDAAALSFISEAWIRYLKRAPSETEEEFEARKDAVRPRDAEDRREVLTVMTMYRDGAGERRVVSDTREIQRSRDGKPSGLTPFRLNRGMDVIGGDAVEAFPEFPPSPAQRHAAQMMLHLAKMHEGPAPS